MTEQDAEEVRTQGKKEIIIDEAVGGEDHADGGKTDIINQRKNIMIQT